MARKSFKTAAPRGVEEFDINDEVFHYNPDIPGAVLLDFLSEADEENPQKMAGVIHQLLDHAVLDTDKERFDKFIRDPKNNVGLETLAEVCGFIAESASGNGQRPGSYGPG